MVPVNNIYYIFASTSQNEPIYDPVNIEMHNPLLQSQQSGYNEYYGESQHIQRRNKEELLHKNWMRRRSDLGKKFQEKMERDMKVRAGDNRVKFIYKCKGHEVLGAMVFRFKIVLVYRNLLRKWYISPGYSFVPEAIDLKGKLKSGTDHPLSEEVFDVIRDVRRLIDVFMTRLTIVYQFVHDAQERYKDVQFAMNAIITTMKLTFTENAWPAGLQRSSLKDSIVVDLKLDKNIRVRNIVYKHIHQKTRSKDIKEELNKLQSKLQNFFDFPLKEAFERFIEEEERYTNSQGQESSE